FHLSGLLHHHEQTVKGIRQAHERWATLHTEGIHACTEWPNDRDPNRRLRVGYIGGDFYENPSFYFLIQFFRNHDRSQVEVLGYDLRCRDDQRTDQFREHCSQWRKCRELTDGQILEQI